MTFLGLPFPSLSSFSFIVILTLVDGTVFERIPYHFSAISSLQEPSQLAEQITTAVLHTESLLREGRVQERLRKEEEERESFEVIDATQLSNEELNQFLKITPQI